MKSLWIRFGVFLGLSAITLASCVFFSNPETDPAIGVVLSLPGEDSDFFVFEEKMGDLERKWLPDDTSFIKRIYVEKDRNPEEARGRALVATLIVAGSDSRSLHRPQVCLKGQHWTIVKREIVELDIQGDSLAVMDFYLERVKIGADNTTVIGEDGKPEKVKAHYVYWWIGPKASTPSDMERVWLELANSIRKGRKERWAYPSVQVIVDERYGREEAQKRAYEFIQRAAPSFQKSLGAQENLKDAH